MRYTGGPIMAIATGVNQATAAASAGGTLPNGVSGAVVPYYLLTATAACHVRFAKTADTPTAVTTDLMIQPGDSKIVHIPQGYTKYAAIRSTADGVLQIQPLENA